MCCLCAGYTFERGERFVRSYGGSSGVVSVGLVVEKAWRAFIHFVFFFHDAATTEIYTDLFRGRGRCVEEKGAVDAALKQI